MWQAKIGLQELANLCLQLCLCLPCLLCHLLFLCRLWHQSMSGLCVQISTPSKQVLKHAQEDSLCQHTCATRGASATSSACTASCSSAACSSSTTCSACAACGPCLACVALVTCSSCLACNATTYLVCCGSLQHVYYTVGAPHAC